MHPSPFDRLANLLHNLSRRDLARALLVAATALPLTPVRIARAQSGNVPPGGICADTRECQQDDMRGDIICADNGFTADGPLACCANEGCCTSDADCCGDLRCAPTGDICSVCLSPPFPHAASGKPAMPAPIAFPR